MCKPLPVVSQKQLEPDGRCVQAWCVWSRTPAPSPWTSAWTRAAWSCSTAWATCCSARACRPPRCLPCSTLVLLPTTHLCWSPAPGPPVWAVCPGPTAQVPAPARLDSSSGAAVQVDAVIVACSCFAPTPSMAAMVVNHFRMRSDVLTYNLSGMGCSASVVCLDLASHLLKVRAPPSAASVRGEEAAHACLLRVQPAHQTLGPARCTVSRMRSHQDSFQGGGRRLLGPAPPAHVVGDGNGCACAGHEGQAHPDRQPREYHQVRRFPCTVPQGSCNAPLCVPSSAKPGCLGRGAAQAARSSRALTAAGAPGTCTAALSARCCSPTACSGWAALPCCSATGALPAVCAPCSRACCSWRAHAGEPLGSAGAEQAAWRLTTPLCALAPGSAARARGREMQRMRSSAPQLGAHACGCCV